MSRNPYAEEREQVRRAWNRLCAARGSRGEHPEVVVDDLLADLNRLQEERAATLRVLAPDVATGDRTLPQVAEAALAVARRGGTL